MRFLYVPWRLTLNNARLFLLNSNNIIRQLYQKEKKTEHELFHSVTSKKKKKKKENNLIMDFQQGTPKGYFGQLTNGHLNINENKLREYFWSNRRQQV